MPLKAMELSLCDMSLSLCLMSVICSPVSVIHSEHCLSTAQILQGAECPKTCFKESPHYLLIYLALSRVFLVFLRTYPLSTSNITNAEFSQLPDPALVVLDRSEKSCIWIIFFVVHFDTLFLASPFFPNSHATFFVPVIMPTKYKVGLSGLLEGKAQNSGCTEAECMQSARACFCVSVLVLGQAIFIFSTFIFSFCKSSTQLPLMVNSLK